MRVCYDDQIFTMQRHGGISRYFVELIRSFRDGPELGIDPRLGWRWTRNAHALEAGLGRVLTTPGGSRGRPLRWANRLFNPLEGTADVVHRTFYRANYLTREPGVPSVVTVHDMTPELFPELFPKGNPHRQKREFIARAQAVVCVSESTRRDLVRLYGPPAAPITVAHLGVRNVFAPGVAPPTWCPDRYLLFVGARDGYKDFRVALEAFAEVAATVPAITLLAVGGGAFTSDEETLLSRWGLGERVIQHDASDMELPGIFGGAHAFVFPSRYEGFGLPTLEAMACGTPVVLADSSSHPEVGGEAALYFPPGDSSALAAQVRRLISDGRGRSDFVANGISRAKRFSWRDTAAATAAAYRVARDAGA
jgi:glycosyltransferase involved in cell wall biosynthesis